MTIKEQMELSCAAQNVFSFPLLCDYMVLASVPNTYSFRKVKCLLSIAQSDHV